MSHTPRLSSSAVMILQELTSMLEAPCRELKPPEPFPFKSNRISRGVRFQHFLILFPFYPEYKKLQHLYSFNLYTRKWGSVELRNSPEILENTDNYKVVSDDENRFILVGCYKAFQTNTTGNLFFQSQAMSLKKTLGYIKAKIDQGTLQNIEPLNLMNCRGVDPSMGNCGGSRAAALFGEVFCKREERLCLYLWRV